MTIADVGEAGRGAPLVPEDLPEGWAPAELCAITGPSSEKVEPQTCPERPYLSLEHIESGTNRIIGYGTAADVRSTKAVFRAGDVLYGKLRPYLNKVAIPEVDGICSTDLLVFRKREWLDSVFLMRFLSLPSVVAFANHHSSGVQLPRVSWDELGEIEIPVPPLAEQMRIVTKLEDLLLRVNAAHERLRRVPAILKRFRQAVLAAACSGRLTEDWRQDHPEIFSAGSALEVLREKLGTVRTRRGVPTAVDVPDALDNLDRPGSWALRSIGSMLHDGGLLDVKDGNHGSNHPRKGEFVSDGMPFITAAQVSGFRVDYEGAPRVHGEALKRLRVGFALPGDALLTHKGSVGRSALNTQECVLTPQTTYYRCRPEVLESRFLVFYFASNLFYRQLVSVMSQTTRDFVPISEQYQLFLVIPPVEEQREIVRRIDALFGLANAIERRISAATVRAERLTQSILAKAFSGELVPTEAELARRDGRDYEPASALLERVRHQSEIISAVDKRRR